MYKKVSRADQINASLEKDQKVKSLNSEEDIEKIASINKYMEDVRKEYQMKESLSQISASGIVLNA